MKMDAVKIDIRANTYKEFHKATRVYIWPKGETLLDNLENRRSRPYTEYRKQVMPKVLAAMGLPSYTKIKWSQYAGCSCPCSPGFIVEGVRGKTVYVDVEAVNG
jgi:hypothetical protein